MVDDQPVYYPMLRKYKEYFVQHSQLYIPPKHYKDLVYDPNSMKKLSCDDPCHKSSTGKASCHHPYSTPHIEIPILYQLH